MRDKAGRAALDYTLTATNAVGFLFYKGPTFDTDIDSVSISSITISYCNPRGSALEESAPRLMALPARPYSCMRLGSAAPGA